MVFTTVANFVRSRGPDEFWRKRKILKLAAHYIGRRRNCYSIAIKNVHRALVYATKHRQLRKENMRQLHETRIIAGCEQHGISYKNFTNGLMKSNVLLNRKSLADLAAWEPFTFKALTDIARQKCVEDGVNIDLSPQKSVDVITKGMLK
ncbi:39S ribosomal protein L20, mitochondrial [Agrilus planipennis]|uniref:Large ribosomal subunit protein bL20m n=1 Tax=Agrilus planipennis TaxID=224129 RepID=A0A1W4WHU5_AGRPL|nr:39S ribosomal protein L20, mitochondrial [Agrilus planipennis]